MKHRTTLRYAGLALAAALLLPSPTPAQQLPGLGLFGMGAGRAESDPGIEEATPEEGGWDVLGTLQGLGQRAREGIDQLAAKQRFERDALAGIEGVEKETRMLAGGLVQQTYYVPEGGRFVDNLRGMLARGDTASSPAWMEKALPFLRSAAKGRPVELIVLIRRGSGEEEAQIMAGRIYVGYQRSRGVTLEAGEGRVFASNPALSAGLAAVTRPTTEEIRRPVPNHPRRTSTGTLTTDAARPDPARGAIAIPNSMQVGANAGLLRGNSSKRAGIRGQSTTRIHLPGAVSGRFLELPVTVDGSYQGWSSFRALLRDPVSEAEETSTSQIQQDAARRFQEQTRSPLIASARLSSNQAWSHEGSLTHRLRGSVRVDLQPVLDAGFEPCEVRLDATGLRLHGNLRPRPMP